LQQKPKESLKPAFKFGTAIHMLLLEPEKAKTHILECDHAANTKKHMAFVQDMVPGFQGDHPNNGAGRYIGTDGDSYYVFNCDEYTTLHHITQCANKHKVYSKLRQHATPEITGIAAEDSPNGTEYLSCRGDLRGTHNGIGFFIDIKTIDYLSEYNIQKQFAEFWYAMQMQHYLYVANKIEPNHYKQFFFYFIEKNWPHECALVSIKLNDAEQEALQKFYLRKLGELIGKRGSEQNEFESLDKGYLAEIPLPGWYSAKLQSF
jgi:hypothetical protein